MSSQGWNPENLLEYSYYPKSVLSEDEVRDHRRHEKPFKVRERESNGIQAMNRLRDHTLRGAGRVVTSSSMPRIVTRFTHNEAVIATQSPRQDFSACFQGCMEGFSRLVLSSLVLWAANSSVANASPRSWPGSVGGLHVHS
jgi:hypothetical protein